MFIMSIKKDILNSKYRIAKSAFVYNESIKKQKAEV